MDQGWQEEQVKPLVQGGELDVHPIQLFSFCFEEQVKPLVQSGELDVHPLQLQLKGILAYQVGHPWLIIPPVKSTIKLLQIM